MNLGETVQPITMPLNYQTPCVVHHPYDVLQNGTPETYVTLLANVTPIHFNFKMSSLKQKKRKTRKKKRKVTGTHKCSNFK